MAYIAVVPALPEEGLRGGGARASRRAEVLRGSRHDEHRDGRSPQSAVGYAAEEEPPRATRAAGAQSEDIRALLTDGTEQLGQRHSHAHHRAGEPPRAPQTRRRRRHLTPRPPQTPRKLCPRGALEPRTDARRYQPQRRQPDRLNHAHHRGAAASRPARDVPYHARCLPGAVHPYHDSTRDTLAPM